MSRDPDSQVSLMLCESILHLLVEERVITKERALEAINGIVELLQESDEIGQCRSTRCSAVPLHGVQFSLLRVVRGAESLGAGYALVGLQPIDIYRQTQCTE